MASEKTLDEILEVVLICKKCRTDCNPKAFLKRGELVGPLQCRACSARTDITDAFELGTCFENLNELMRTLKNVSARSDMCVATINQFIRALQNANTVSDKEKFNFEIRMKFSGKDDGK